VAAVLVVVVPVLGWRRAREVLRVVACRRGRWVARMRAELEVCAAVWGQWRATVGSSVPGRAARWPGGRRPGATCAVMPRRGGGAV